MGETTAASLDLWREPVRGDYPEPSVFGLSGLHQLHAAKKAGGPRPPISRLTGMTFVEADEEHTVFEMPASEWFLSSQDQISAGPLLMLADGALGTAVQIGLPAATPYTTAELSMTFLQPCPAGGMIRSVGTLVHMGSPLALSAAWVHDGEGRPVAHGTSSCYVFAPREDIEPPEAIEPYVEPQEATPDPYLRPLAGETIPWEVWRTMPGLEILRRQIAGELPPPPIHHLLGLTLREASEGAATFSMPATEWLASPFRTIEGGAIAMLAHAAVAIAVTSTLELGAAYRPVDVKINFLRPVKPADGELVACGVVTHRGKTLAVANSEVVGPDGKKVATATGSTMILPQRHPSR
ncbi:MAG: PaaI family thioesterase [Actinomycetota bacterium]